MIALTLGDVATATGGRLAGGASGATPVSGPVVVDSRAAAPGSLFVALTGERVDGHDFAGDAVRAGAVGMLAHRDVGVPAVLVDDPLAALGRLAAHVMEQVRDVTVIGITGSNGKTTTKDLTAEVLAGQGSTSATPGSYNGEIGLPLSILNAAPGTRFLVLEYGARGVGQISALTRIAPPRIAVVLGIGVAHVGVFGSRDAIAVAKGELVEALDKGGVAVLNADDDLVAAMARRTSATVMTFGRSDAAQVRALDVTVDGAGRAAFDLVTAAGSAHVALQIVGEHQVGNALAAAAVALALGMSLGDVAAALSSARPASRWRMEVVERADGVTVINDAYNANPDSMAAALRALLAIGAGRHTHAVIGAMGELGDISDAAHREVGRLAVELGVAHLVVVGEAASAVADGARAALRDRRDAPSAATRVDVVSDTGDAVDLLTAALGSGDVVLVKASRAAGLERVADTLTAEVVDA